MNERYAFTPDEIDSIRGRFGAAFYEKAVRDLETYADRWALDALQLIPSYSSNLVFTCESAHYGGAVLKIGNPAFGTAHTEYEALREYNGRRFCQAWSADPDNDVLLEERVQPGKPLRDEMSLEARLAVFCSLYQGLHIAPADPGIYPTYTRWVSRITEYMSARQDCEALSAYMRKANEICSSLSVSYGRNLLLHGDFHHDNMLLGPDGQYVIIDPKGVVGDPVFDVPRFILNEFDDDITPALYAKINRIIGILEQELHIPQRVLAHCLFVETAMGACWNVEDGAAPEEFPRLTAQVAFAEEIMNQA